MRFEDAMTLFRERYAVARDDSRRRAAIRQFRSAALPSDPGADVTSLTAVLKTLLDHAGRDGAAARRAALELVQQLWRGLSRRSMDALFTELIPRLTECYDALGATEREVAREIVRCGFKIASPALVEGWSLATVTAEAKRCFEPAVPYCVRIGWFAFALHPPPNLDLLRLVVEHAPARVWPRLVRDLWRLYNLDFNLADSLVLSSRPPLGQERHRVQVRRTSRGHRVVVTSCWDLAERMLRRTLTQARPEDLGDAAPLFFEWLETLAVLPEDDLRPFPRLLVNWAVPPVVRVLDRWGAPPRLWDRLRGASARSALRGDVARALAEVRAALGASREVVPAASLPMRGHEPVPARSAPVGDHDAAPAG
jgi:hypothetical protein